MVQIGCARHFVIVTAVSTRRDAPRWISLDYFFAFALIQLLPYILAQRCSIIIVCILIVYRELGSRRVSSLRGQRRENPSRVPRWFHDDLPHRTFSVYFPSDSDHSCAPNNVDIKNMPWTTRFISLSRSFFSFFVLSHRCDKNNVVI